MILGCSIIKEKNHICLGFFDSDYAGDLDDRKRTSGYAFMLGSTAVSWSSKKQPIVTCQPLRLNLLL